MYSVPVSGGNTSRVLMENSIGGRMIGDAFLAFSSPKNATEPIVAEMSLVSTLDPAPSLHVATEVPVNPSLELFAAGERAVFTDLTAGREGIYATSQP